MNFHGFLFFGVILNATPSQAFERFQNIKFECNEISFVKNPSYQGGFYQLPLENQCVLTILPHEKAPMSRILQMILNEIRHSPRLTIHHGPEKKSSSVNPENSERFEVDLSDQVDGDQGGVIIRQNLTVYRQGEQKLCYLSNSTSIQAGGLASYLKHALFQIEFEAIPGESAGGLQAKLTNEISLDRPWFALPFLFEPFVKDVALSKFKQAREKIFSYLTKKRP